MPAAYKTVSVTLPAPLWEQMIDSLDMELANQVLDAVKKPNSAVVKALVKDAIEQHVYALRGKKLLDGADAARVLNYIHGAGAATSVRT